MSRLTVIGLIFLLSFFSLELDAQVEEIDTLTVSVIGQEQGLSQLNALALDFDSLGYLWIGTENGLNRFNAYEMKTYMAGEDNNSPIDDHIRDLYYDNDTLWMATNTHSLTAYMLKENKFIDFDKKLNFDRDPGLKYSNTIQPIGRRYIVLGTNGNCLLYDKRKDRFYKIPLPLKDNNDFVTAITRFNNNYYVGTNGHGIFELDLEKRKIKRLEDFDLLRDTKINALYPYSNDKLLIATRDDIYWYDRVLSIIEPVFKNRKQFGEITQIQKWDDDQLVLITANGMYLLTDKIYLKKIVLQNLEKDELSVELTQVKEDDQGGRWLATKGRGVLYYHAQLKKFKPYRIRAANTPRNDFISVFNFLREGDNLWMATEFGFARYNFETKVYKFYPRESLEYTLARDQEGHIWGGGFGQGLVRYNSKYDSFDTIRTIIPDKDVIHITPMGKDSIWVHTWSNGIYAVNIHDFNIHKKSIRKDGLVRSRTSYIDRKGRIWIGSDEGIYRVTEGEIVCIDSLSNPRVFSITEDFEGNIWVGTAMGLNRIDYETDEVSSYTMSSGLPNNFIYGVEVDDRGHIWSSTNFGLSELNPKDSEFRNYTALDGLQNNEFNGKASYKDTYGNLYFGGMNGFNVFDPKTIFINRKTGKTLIEDVQLFGKTLQLNLPYLKEVVFSHNQNVISFDYTTLSFLWANKNRYQFRLKNFDKDWRAPTRMRNTTYTNLNPGHYTFEVRGSNNDGIWTEPSSLKIVIRTPWYKTLWFKLAGGILIVMIVLGIILYRSYRQKIINRRLMKMVKAQTKELRFKNMELQESLTLSEEQRRNISYLMRELNHRVKNNLQIITSLIDIQDLSITDPDAKERLKLLQKRIFTASKIHDILRNVKDKENIRIDIFLEQLTKEIVAFSGRAINVQINAEPILFPMERLSYLGLILNELITNSIKHAFNKQSHPKIEILLTLSGADTLSFIFRDNGKGYIPDSQDSKKGMGIQLIKFLSQKLSGKISYEKNEGTAFKMQFPCKKESL